MELLGGLLTINIKRPEKKPVDRNLIQDQEILEGTHPKQNPPSKLPASYVPGGKRAERKVTQPGVSIFGNNRPSIK